jgi:hypothetical protein
MPLTTDSIYFVNNIGSIIIARDLLRWNANGYVGYLITVLQEILAMGRGNLLWKWKELAE